MLQDCTSTGGANTCRQTTEPYHIASTVSRVEKQAAHVDSLASVGVQEDLLCGFGVLLERERRRRLGQSEELAEVREAAQRTKQTQANKH